MMINLAKYYLANKVGEIKNDTSNPYVDLNWASKQELELLDEVVSCIELTLDIRGEDYDLKSLSDMLSEVIYICTMLLEFNPSIDNNPKLIFNIEHCTKLLRTINL